MLKVSPEFKEFFTNSILNWYFYFKRDFPWRNSNDPYKVMVSEVLLQQTNAEKVVPIFNAVISLFPNIDKLAQSHIKELKPLFSEIGLFYRADRLKNIAEEIINKFNGTIPKTRAELIGIKGVGDYSGNAILCFGYNLRYPIVDTNIIRIFDRFFGITSDKPRPRTDNDLWEFAEWLLPIENYQDFNYSLLDFGAVLCKHYNPVCEICPIKDECFSWR